MAMKLLSEEEYQVFRLKVKEAERNHKEREE